MLQPGLTVESLFKRVRTAVARETGNRQVPWEASSLVGDYCLAVDGGGSCGAPPPDGGRIDLAGLRR